MLGQSICEIHTFFPGCFVFMQRYTHITYRKKERSKRTIDIMILFTLNKTRYEYTSILGEKSIPVISHLFLLLIIRAHTNNTYYTASQTPIHTYTTFSRLTFTNPWSSTTHECEPPAPAASTAGTNPTTATTTAATAAKSRTISPARLRLRLLL